MTTSDNAIPLTGKLGKALPRHDRRTLQLSHYLTPKLPSPPTSLDWTSTITQFGQMLNDNLGCCTIAACAHAIQIWSAVEGTEITVPDTTILKYYSAWAGYVPGESWTDRGAVILDILNDWRKQGFGADPQLMHKLIAYAQVENSMLSIQQAMTLFGGVYLGVALPITAQNQVVWDVVPNAGPDGAPYSWGGHAIYCPRYDPSGLWCVTWGGLKLMTWAFVSKYADEIFALLSDDWVPNGHNLMGLTLADLLTDLQQVTG